MIIIIIVIVIIVTIIVTAIVIIAIANVSTRGVRSYDYDTPVFRLSALTSVSSQTHTSSSVCSRLRYNIYVS